MNTNRTNTVRPIDIHAERYRIFPARPDGSYVVRTFNSAYGSASEELATLADLRTFVADLRETGAIPAEQATYRAALIGGDWHKLYNATLAEPYDPADYEIGEAPRPYGFREWGISANRENLTDLDNRYLTIPYCHSNPCGDDLLGQVNADALLELESENSEDVENTGLVWAGNSLLLDLEAEAIPEVLEAILGLEGYPVIDDEALSEAEGEEDAEQWALWGRAETIKELAEALGLGDADSFGLDADAGDELDSELLETAWESGRPSEASSKGIALDWILRHATQPRRYWGDFQVDGEERSAETIRAMLAQHEADRLRLAKPRALAALFDNGALRFYSDDTKVRDVIEPSRDEEANAQALVDVIGPDASVADLDVQRVAAAIAIHVDGQDRTAPLPFAE